MENNEYCSIDEIKEKQFDKLKKIIDHCYTNVQFYKKKFDDVGFKPDDLKDFSDLKCIPYLTKNDVQKNMHLMVAKNYTINSLFLDSSGGSTGKPTNFYKDKRRWLEGVADQYRHDRWCGWDVGEKVVKLWGAQREFEKQISKKYALVEKYIFRVYGFNAFDISERKIIEYVRRLEKIRPTMVMAYVNVAVLFASVIKKNNIDLSRLKLKGLICSAETLTQQKRAVIEEAFACKVLNRYGSREVGLIASECLEQNGLHVNTDGVYVEIEKKGQETAEDEIGEIIVTDLWNYGMPFIRYQMGDVAAKSFKRCGCGRNLPIIKDVNGRVSDFFVDANGGLIHGEYFTHLFYGVEGVEQFQFVQEDTNVIRLRILPGENFSLSVLEPVIYKTKQCIGSNIHVDIEICNSSFIEESGKFRFTISNVANKCFNE
ncbi:hypothetical protein [uncultured Desulfobulbus sp.]|uniref:phenylacetate--CoA ligase family protein n=1 Tax=uncultured Desulfobulbus sp. TaxID=239745 RepID=UPI0029C74933|nr:hypothetical protein [uncultured Desulfobulbus sp.]